MQAISANTDLKLSFDSLVRKAEDLCERGSMEALAYIKDATMHSHASGNGLEACTSQYLQAYYQTSVLGHHASAIETISTMIPSLDSESMDTIGYKTYATLGHACRLNGDSYGANQSYRCGIKLLESKGVHNAYESKTLASLYYHNALLASDTGITADTELHLRNAINIYTEYRAAPQLSACYILYGSLLTKAERNFEALYIFEKALDLNIRSNDEYGIALTRAHLGTVKHQSGDYSIASCYFYEALYYFEKKGHYQELAATKLGLGKTLFSNGTKQKGIYLCYEAEDLFADLESTNELSQCYQTIAKMLREDNQHEKAYEYLDKYNESRESILKNDKKQALANAKREFEYEQQDKVAHLLQQKTSEIQQYVSKLEHSNNGLKQFAHVVSHDMREPLRMINSYMRLLERSIAANMTAQQKVFLEFAIGGAKRLDNMIVGILQLAKVDANPVIETVNMESIVEEIRLNLDLMLKEKNAVILSTNLPEIKADRTQVLQLFQNLIANGLKYNESSQPRVVINASAGHGSLEINVSDNGIGIPAESREKVFELFSRLSADKYSGSGIGLSVCKKIVDNMDGQISIEDNPYGGTTFRMVFGHEILPYFIRPKK